MRQTAFTAVSGLAGAEAASLWMISAAPVWNWNLLGLLVTGGAGTGVGIAAAVAVTYWKEKKDNGKPRTR